MGVSPSVMAQGEAFQPLGDALKVAVAALRDAHVPFVLGGSLAAWARGGPEPQHDLDLMVKPADAEAALRALEDVGMRPERPPEEWLFKAWHGDVMIDLIFKPSGLALTDEVFARAETIAVLSVATPVMALEDVLATKLHALGEHNIDYTNLLAIARSVREQIDWPQLRARTCDWPYAQPFFTLVEQLGIAPGPAKAHPAAPSRVRVVSSGS
jgi:hypothetical protein